MHMLLVNRLFTNVVTNTSFNRGEVAFVQTNDERQTVDALFSECIVCQSLCTLCKRMLETNDQNMCAKPYASFALKIKKNLNKL